MPKVKKWTRSEYYRLGELGLLDCRTELLDGDVLVMEPIGPGHATATELVASALRGCSGARNFAIRVQEPLSLGADEPQPDVAVVVGHTRDFANAHPRSARLVVEVSDATRDQDRTTKRDLYASCGVPEYWVLDLVERRLYVYRDPQRGHYVEEFSLSPGESVTPPCLDRPIAVDELLP